MSDVRIVLNTGAVAEQLLRGPEIEALCRELAEGIAAQAGEGYGVDTFQGATRVVSICKAQSWKAYHDNLQNNTLLKARGG